jgi:hypothetical protein
MPNARFYKISAICAVAGSLVALAANVIHPDLPIGVREAHALIASRSDWRVTHLAIIVAALLLSYGLAGLASACARSGSGVDRLALLTIIVGASVVAVSIGIDGFAEKTLSDAWASAPPAQQTQILVSALPIQLIHVGLFYVWGGIFWGLGFILFGWAIVDSRALPAWFGWIAFVGGVLVSIATVAQYLSPHDSVEIAFRLLLFVEILWTLALGLFMWRLSKAFTWENDNLLRHAHAE